MWGWCIVTLASARLKASVRFPPLREMYQTGGTCKGCDNDCDTSKWHIARISHKSNAKCSAQQRTLNMKCMSKIAKGQKGTAAPTYRGRKQEYGTKREVIVDF